jgi:hypothetical protein
MDTQEVRKKRLDLEDNVVKLLRDFTEECGVEVSDLVLKKDVFTNGAFGSAGDRICIYNVKVRVEI